MAIHFPKDELAARRRAVTTEGMKRGIAGILIFRQESMYYLTGYDTMGFCFFQCLYLGVDGRMTLLTRLPDLRQAQITSDIRDIRVWSDVAGANPAIDLRQVLVEHGCEGRKLGIEFDAYGLTAANWRTVEVELRGFCSLEDASDIVSGYRMVKSAMELDYVRRAAKLADAAFEEARQLAVPGAFEGDILAAMHAVIFKGDGDYPGNEFIIGSGREALLVRYHSGRRYLSSQDQLMLEFAGTYRHYHACMIRTIIIGTPDPAHREMYQACETALLASIDAVKPGRPMGDVFDAHAKVMDSAGYTDHRLNACGYGLGATFSPTWMEQPLFYHGNELEMVPNMVFFIHMILLNSETGRAMALGNTVRVTETACEPLSETPLALVVNRE